MLQHDEPAARTIRRFLLLILGTGMIGSAADLVLLEHYEDVWQLPPLGLIGVALVLAVWLGFRSTSRVAVLAFRMTMTAFIAAGVAGVLLHFNGNAEFQRELDPGLEGWPLVVKVMTAKAPPALAPGSMVYMGLLGLLYTFRHPALEGPSPATPNRTGAQS